MSYRVLARKWRPGTFKELTGQEHVSRTLENAIRKGRIAHAYLFSGVRGVGKTTVARILARSLNCINGPTPDPCMQCDTCIEVGEGSSVDVIEIDGASHTGVDNVRDLQEKALYAPLRGRYKIYIIDEIHMLSTAAFNALLKILEEPPSHLIFIFATTEPHRIPSTIHSRCQHLQFRRMSNREIMERLLYILEEEGVRAEREALSLIARASDGSMRDALSLLDQVISYTEGEISREDVAWILGVADTKVEPLMNYVLKRDTPGALSIFKEVVDGGYDLKQFCSTIIEYIRNLLLIKYGLGENDIDLIAEKIEEMVLIVKDIPGESLQRLINIFTRALEEMRWFPNPRFSMEIAIIKATHMRPVVAIDEILKRLHAIEARIGSRKGSWPSISGKSNPGEGIEKISYTPSQEESQGADVFIDENTIDTSWSSIIEKIKEKRPNLGSYLEQGRPVGVIDGILTIEFSGGASIFKDLIDRKECRELILDIVRSYLPDVKRVSFNTSTRNSHSPAYSEYLTREHERKREEVEEAFSETIVQEAIDIFGGELVELKNLRNEQEG